MFDQFIHNGPSWAVQMGFVWSLVMATILGAIMGLERSLAGKHAGMRTYALVALGSCLFVVVGTLASFEMSFFSGLNPLQIASSVVIGIGFIGSGLAALHGGNPVELTTASGLWVAAAVGMACGFGLYVIAIATVVVSVVILSLFSRVEHRLRVRYGVKAN